jgi:penicillin-binding protein 1A
MKRSWQTAMAIVMLTAAPAWPQAATNSGLPGAAQQEPGSQLVPAAQPPFSPAADGAMAKPAQGGGNVAVHRPSLAVEGVGAGSGSTAPPAQCDISLCTGRYRSFRVSDCTYQPYTGGPRRLCER